MASIISVISLVTGASLAEAPKVAEPPAEARTTLVRPPVNPLAEFANVPIPSLAWVIAKARCETGLDWRNKGVYGGAWGFMHRGYGTDASGLPNESSWGRWGGFLYAKHPSKATPTEQVIVYLRINWGGWHRPNGMYRKPSTSQNTANKCYIYANKVAGPVKPKLRDIDKWWTDFQRVVYFASLTTHQK